MGRRRAPSGTKHSIICQYSNCISIPYELRQCVHCLTVICLARFPCEWMACLIVRVKRLNYFKIYGTNLSISKFMAQTLTGNNRKLIQVAGQLSMKDAGYCMARHAIRGNYCMAVDQLDCKILITTK